MIKLVNVSKFYSSNNVIALGLRKVNLELHRNEFVAIVGESGSGKTTLLNVISGIDSYEDGEMYINGNETSYYSVEDMENYRKKYVAFVFQNYNLIDSYTVLQNVEAPLILSGYPKDKIRSRAMEIIKKVGLEDHINHKSTKLSGGQKQRVVIARALAKDCPIIAADEPTGNLDSKSAKQIIKLLHEISKDKLVIVVTHDFSQIADHATRKIRIYDGEIVEDHNITKTEKLDLPDIPDEDHKIRFMDYLKIALRNLWSVPKKSFLMYIVFAFFSFFIAMSYGAYQLSMQEINTNSNAHFANTNPNRIVIHKTDTTDSFTDDELNDLANESIVADVVAFDYVLDSRVYLESVLNSSMNFDGLYLPMSLVTQEMLDYGVMPTSDNEIILAINGRVISSNRDNLIEEYFQTITNKFPVEYKVVGLVDVSKLIVSPESQYQTYFLVTENQIKQLAKDLYLNYTEYAYLANDTTSNGGESNVDLRSMNMVIDNSLADDEFRLSKSYYYSADCETDTCTYDATLKIKDNYVEIEKSGMTLVYSADIKIYNTIYLNQNTYDSLFYDEVYQVSILTNTEVGVNTLLRSLERESLSLSGLKYKVLYPYDSEAATSLEALMLLMMNIGFIVLIFVTMLGSTLITYVIFRAIINTKLHDYAIFRTIGANKTVIKSFIYLENLFLVLLAYITLVIVTLAIPLDLVDNTIFQPLKMYDFVGYLVFLLLLVVMSLVISRKYCNRIFSETVQRTLKTDMG